MPEVCVCGRCCEALKPKQCSAFESKADEPSVPHAFWLGRATLKHEFVIMRLCCGLGLRPGNLLRDVMLGVFFPRGEE